MPAETAQAAQPVIALGVWHLLLLAVPVAVVISVSVALRLGQCKRVSIAVIRAIVQLVAVGLVIGWVFTHNTWYWIVGLLVVMTLIAAGTAGSQVGKWFSGFVRASLLLSMILAAATSAMLLYLGTAVIGVNSWDARYLIPLGGMLLGNAMTAAVLAAERIGSEMRQHAGDVEAYLALGASPWQASHPFVRRAITAALTPTLNAMMIVGVVKLPGMMTGQMLGGSAPFQAAMYQLLILIGILTCDTLTATTTSILLYRRFFTNAWQLNRAALRG